MDHYGAKRITNRDITKADRKVVRIQDIIEKDIIEFIASELYNGTKVDGVPIPMQQSKRPIIIIRTL